MTKQKFLWLVKKYYKTMTKQATYYSKGADGEEIVNSFVVYVLNRKSHLAMTGSNTVLKNWLYVCIRNQAWRHLRLEKERAGVTTGEDELFYTPERLELQADVRKALDLLAPDDRTCALGVLMGNDTYETMAEILGIRPSEVLLKVEELKDFFSAYLSSYNVGKLQGKTG